MTKREQKLWDEAYESSHVAANVCEMVVDRGAHDAYPPAYRLEWLLEEAKNLPAAARALRRAGCSQMKPKNERTHEVKTLQARRRAH